MAEPKSGLDPANINYYGADPADTQAYQDALQASVTALEQRYANPNWFNVAAGFFKPQLGGFAASLGSASQALGENVEKQRESALPLAQMRAQLAASKIAMGQKKAGADLVTGYEGEGAPLHKLPDLVAKLTQLGSPLAAGPKARLDEARKSQDTIVQRAQLIRASNDQELAKINSDLANKVIDIKEAGRRRAALPAVPEVSDMFAPPPPPPGVVSVDTSQTGSSTPSTVQNTSLPKEAGYAPPKPGQAVPEAAAAVVPAAPPAAEKVYIKPSVDLSDELNLTDAEIRARAELAVSNAKKGSEIQDYLRITAGPETYNDNTTPIQNALGLLGYGVKDPVEKAALEAKARKVMNVLSGSTFNALLKSVNTGVGGKVGDLYAQISLPVEDFVRARFKGELQTYARDLAQNLALAAIARQKLGGISPNSARNAELHLYGEASPTLNAEPLSAMKNLMHLHTSFDQLKDMNDFINQVDKGEHPEYQIDPKNTVTRIYDIARSKGYTSIADMYGDKHREIEKFTRGRQ
jgi:hypothetical protein